MPCAKVGPSASEAASLSAASGSASGSCSALKKPQARPSSAFMERPVNSSSLARPWPMTRGSSAQAPMSAPARPTRVNRKAVLVRGVPRRRSDASAIMAPAPAHTPSMAATMGCGQARMAATSAPVMRVKASSSGMVMVVSGPMISCTSPPEQKLPPAPVSTTAFTSVARCRPLNQSRNSA